MVGCGSAGISRGERDKNIAGAVAGDAAVAAEAKRDAARQALQLVRDERCVRGNNDDNRAVVFVYKGSPGVRNINGNFPSHGNPGDAQIIFRTVVTLHKNSNGVAAVFRLELS